jgi:ATP synthase protein I
MSARRPSADERDAFGRAISSDERRIARRARGKGDPLLGLATLGMVGWSIVVPTLLGIAGGIALDARFPQGRISWTLSLMTAGLVIGVFNATYWVKREQRSIEQEHPEKDEVNDE